MKNFKLNLLAVLAVFIISSVFIACSNEDDSNLDVMNLKLENFSKNFPNLTSKISYENIQEVNKNETGKLEITAEGITFPIIDNNTVIGRYFGVNNENVAVYIDYSNYQNEIIIYNVNNPTEFEVINMVLDTTTNIYAPQMSENGKASFWCAASCTIGSVAIALSDGPLPIMDYLAVAAQIACLADCEE